MTAILFSGASYTAPGPSLQGVDLKTWKLKVSLGVVWGWFWEYGGSPQKNMPSTEERVRWGP